MPPTRNASALVQDLLVWGRWLDPPSGRGEQPLDGLSRLESSGSLTASVQSFLQTLFWSINGISFHSPSLPRILATWLILCKMKILTTLERSYSPSRKAAIHKKKQLTMHAHTPPPPPSPLSLSHTLSIYLSTYLSHFVLVLSFLDAAWQV